MRFKEGIKLPKYVLPNKKDVFSEHLVRKLRFK